MKNKKLIAMCLIVMLAGCKTSTPEPEEMVETESTISGDYGAQLPFQSQESRQKHDIMSRSLQDTMNIGSGLLELSKAHFSSSDYVMQEGKFLTYDILDASDFSTGLLGRKSDSNPIGLNPAKDSDFDSGNGMIQSPVILSDIYEIDFVKNSEVKGISIAIVLNPKQGKTTISDDKLLEYGSGIAKELEEYIRTLEGVGDLPIYMTLYNTSSTDDELPGSFMADAFYNNGSKPELTKIDEKWVMLPSTRADELDSITSGQFSTISDKIHDFLTDDVEMIGKAKFKSGALTDLRITVTIHAKTATEAKALTQYLKTLLGTFTSQEFRIRLELKCDDENIAIMERLKGDGNVSVIELI